MKTSPSLLVTKKNPRRILTAFLITLLLIVQTQAGFSAIRSFGLAVTGPAGANSIGAQTANTNSISATGVDGMTFDRAEGVVVTGLDGVVVTGLDGNPITVDSLFIQQANGVSATNVQGVVVTGLDGVLSLGSDAFSVLFADGLLTTAVDSLSITSAQAITATGLNGTVFSIPPTGVVVTGLDELAATGVSNLAVTGADSIIGLINPVTPLVGLQITDPGLVTLLNSLTDDSNVNAAIVYHKLPTEADLNNLRAIGILGGTRYHALPVIVTTTTKRNLLAASRLPAVRSIYGNRTLKTVADPGRGLTGVDRARTDAELTSRNNGSPLSGRGVTVAVLDTGLNGLHGDLANRVVQNVKLVGPLGLGVGFNYPASLENIPNTDLVSGHGTFVGGVIAGSGASSGGKYTGVAPGAKLLGLSAGDLSLFFVLEGFDYLLWRGANYGVKVVNCSFSAETVYDTNDPVNIATKMLTDRGINVVFSAGNSGPGLDTLNPYARAPWVIGVGATDEKGRLAGFSARGNFQSPDARPTLVAPGVNIVSLRSSPALSVTGVLGIQSGVDMQMLTPAEIPFYTTASGTSFSAPQVAGAIALMLEANPTLTPFEVRRILERTAIPLPPYYPYEVGAGMLNVYAAALEAEFPNRRLGTFRATLDKGQVRFSNPPTQRFSGVAQPNSPYTINFTVPSNALFAAVRIDWSSTLLVNNLDLTLIAPSGAQYGTSNLLNLPLVDCKCENIVINKPMAGALRAQVKNTLGRLGGPLSFTGTLNGANLVFSPITDVSDLSPTARDEVYQNIGNFVMAPSASKFRPSFTVSRYDLASALVLGGRVPQYLPSQPRFTDVRDGLTMTMVGSAQSAPSGALFPAASPGGAFRPNARADRLTAAIALVRAAGLRSNAEALAGSALSVTDQNLIPSQYRGYVALALNRGLLTTSGGMFRPTSALTRLELSHAMVTLARLATQ